ncbi:hypothetical protein LUZ60_001467 [Juncus effusus]|nr:hypothetical protein LUZ60_001467 [Juncus effusus]
MARGGRGKRERSDSAAPPPLSKRLRRPSPAGDVASAPAAAVSAPAQVIVTGLPSDCSVLELKFRLEQYGSVSRIRIDVSGSGHVTFRSDGAAQEAILASLDPRFGISVGSNKILVIRSSETVLESKARISSYRYSKLLRPEPPLSKHGRSNKKLTAGELIPSTRTELDSRFKGREIVAYDDLF